MRSFVRVLSVVLLVAWMCFIFYMSAQPAETSSQISGDVIEVIAEKLYPDFDTLRETQRQEVVASFQFTVRKSAHVAGFAVLGFFSFLSFISYTKLRFFTRLFLATSVSVIYAASDELHQHFVPGRSCELRDFLLDIAGVFGAILLCTAFVKIIGPLRRITAFSGKTRKELYTLNYQLSQTLNDVNEDKKVLERRVEAQNTAIDKLQVALAQKSDEIVEIEAKAEESKVEHKKKIELSNEIEYASRIIGEAVIEVTKTCNKLTAENSENTKELVNLALGRNEVLKAEILRILGLNITFEEKQSLILKEKQEAYDYFNSIIAQIC